jgi:O-antigen/teichoic acid export membrane protein
MIWYFVPRIGAAALMIVNMVILTRLLGPGEFGLYNIAMTAAGLGFSILFGWLAAAIHRFHRSSDFDGEATSMALSLTLWVSLAATVAFVLALPFIHGFPLAYLFVAFTTFLAHSLHEIGLSGLRVLGDGPRFMLSTLVRPLIAVALGVALILGADLAAEGALIGTTIGAGLLAAYGIWWTVQRTGVRAPKASYVKQFAFYGAPLSVVASSSMVMSLVAQTTVVTFAGLGGMGAYAAAAALVNRTVDMPMSMMSRSFAADVFQAHEEHGAEASSAEVARLAPPLFLVAIPITIVLMVSNETVARILFGSALVGEVAPHMPYLALAMFLMSVQGAYYSFSFMLGRRTGLQAILIAVVVLLHALATVVLVSRFGPIGAAYAMLVTAIFSLSATVVVGGRVHKIQLPWRRLAPLFPAAGLLAAAAWMADLTQGILPGLAWLAAGTLAYAITLDLLGFPPIRALRAHLVRLWSRRPAGVTGESE